MESRPDIPTWYVRQERLEVETTQEIESSIHILMIVQSPFQVSLYMDSSALITHYPHPSTAANTCALRGHIAFVHTQ